MKIETLTSIGRPSPRALLRRERQEGMLISGGGFLYESALTVPFFRDGNIPDSMIVAALKDIRNAYEFLGEPVTQDEFQAVLDHYNLPGTAHLVPRSKRQDLLPQIW